jgi:myo-inositol-1(or 4)-monophosphatase
MLRENFTKDFKVSFKGVIDPVTELDRKSESLITSILSSAFPDYSILAEEDHAQVTPGANCWIVDPLDGTVNYMHHLPHFTVSIALMKHGEITLGVVYNPILDEQYVAQKGQGAWMNWQAIQVSKTSELSKALLASGFPYDAWSTSRDNLAEWEHFTKCALTPRCSGCASVDLCFVAAGVYDGYWELDLEPWDMAAGALIVKEAGGVVTDVAGNPFEPLGSSILAANPKMHKHILSGLNQVKGTRSSNP